MKSMINLSTYYFYDENTIVIDNINESGNKAIPQMMIKILQGNAHLEDFDNSDSEIRPSGNEIDDSDPRDSAPSEEDYERDSGEDNEEPDEKTNFHRSENEFEKKGFSRKSLGNIDYLEEDDEIYFNTMTLHKKYNKLPGYIKKAFYDNINKFFNKFIYWFENFIKKPINERHFYLEPFSQLDFLKDKNLQNKPDPDESFFSTVATRYFIKVNGIRYNIDDLFDQKSSISINTFALSLYILENFEELEKLNKNKPPQRFNMKKTAAYLAEKLKKDKNIDLCIANNKAAFVKSVKSAFNNALERRDYFYENYIERYSR